MSANECETNLCYSSRSESHAGCGLGIVGLLIANECECVFASAVGAACARQLWFRHNKHEHECVFATVVGVARVNCTKIFALARGVATDSSTKSKFATRTRASTSQSDNVS